MYDERFYREWTNREGLERFEVRIDESDLFILASSRLDREAHAALAEVRRDIETYIQHDERFLTSLEPIAVDDDAPATVKAMADAGHAWNVGPMAAVAGTVAQAVGERLAAETETVIVENGGDIYARSPRKVSLALYAGEGSPFGDKLAMEVDATNGVAVCTSSGVVGPSLSLGRADAVVAVSRDGAFADAAATALANEIRTPPDVEVTLRKQELDPTLAGLIAACGDRLGAIGDIELRRRAEHQEVLND